MKRRTRKNPMATARDLGTFNVVDSGVGDGTVVVTINGVPVSPPFAASATTWPAVNDKPPVMAVGATEAVARSAISVLPDLPGFAPSWTKFGDEVARPTYPTIVVIGDSFSAYASFITAWNGSNNSRKYYYRTDGYLPSAMIAARQPGSFYDVAVGGQSASQGLARFDTDVSPLRPRVVIVQFGFNDINGGDRAVADVFADLQAMYQKAWAIGAKVIGATVAPGATSMTSAKRQKINELNGKLREYAVTNPLNFALADLNAAVVEPTTSISKSDLVVVDEIHPNAKGAWTIGQAFVKPLQRFLPDALSPLPVVNNPAGTVNDPNNLIDNGFLLGTSGGYSAGTTGQAATGWSIFPTDPAMTMVASKIARSDGYGDWQQLTITGNANPSTGYSYWTKDARAEWAVGDIVQACAEFEVDSGWTPGLFDMQLTCINGGTTYHRAAAYGAGMALGMRPTSGILLTPPIAIPSGTVTLRSQLMFGGLGTVRFGRVRVRKLPPA